MQSKQTWDPLQLIADSLEDIALVALPSEDIGRIKVTYSCSAADQVVASARMRLAFDMLHRHAPMWFRRVQSELNHIVVMPLGRGVGGWYEESSGRCVINATPLIDQGEFGAFGVMFILVHETTHAWLHRRGVRFLGEKGRLREERMCNHAEAALAARLPTMPGLAEAVARRRAQISATDDVPGAGARTDVLEQAVSQFLGRLFGPKG
jgi:hypothetical protein